MEVQEGYARIYVEDEIVRIEDWIEAHDEKDIERVENVYLVIDRLSVDDSKEAISRLTDSCETAFFEGDGMLRLMFSHRNSLTTFLRALRLTVLSLKILTTICFRSILRWELVLLAKALDVL